MHSSPCTLPVLHSALITNYVGERYSDGIKEVLCNQFKLLVQVAHNQHYKLANSSKNGRGLT